MKYSKSRVLNFASLRIIKGLGRYFNSKPGFYKDKKP